MNEYLIDSYLIDSYLIDSYLIVLGFPLTVFPSSVFPVSVFPTTVQFVRTPLSGFPTTVRRKNEPLSEKPSTEKPTTENPTLINNIYNKTTPRNPPEGDAAFDRFWSRYPRKQDKAKARRAWAKLAPDGALAERIMAALEVQRRSESWTREGGRYIPMPSTWLNGRRWEDELPPGPDRRPPAREEYGWQ